MPAISSNQEEMRVVIELYTASKWDSVKIDSGSLKHCTILSKHTHISNKLMLNRQVASCRQV
jgi:hypothetical protein